MGKFFKVRISDWINNFRNINLQDSSEYGVTYITTKQVWTTLHRHESFQGVIDTVIHESLHQGIASAVTGEDMNESETMDREQEHEMLLRVVWLCNGWIDLDDAPPPFEGKEEEE